MKTLNCKGVLLDLSKPKVMGVLNVTPDSFFDGGMYEHLDQAMQKVDKMILDGVDIIDVGGMSSRPGAEIIDVEEEKKRVLPVIGAIRIKYPQIIISIDTVHSDVAQTAIETGANMVNDISGGNIDSNIWDVCIDNTVPYILMHMQGKPKDMQDNPHYEDVVLDILNYLKNKVHALHEKGLYDIVIDPGFGFGKTVKQNYTLLRRLSSFKILNCPVLAGISRKSMIYKVLDTDARSALNGTTAAHMVALQNGAKILRVHDVREAVECVKIYKELQG